MLDKIKPYWRDVIINLQKSDTWKIQLTIAINFIFSKNVDEERVMHSKSDNIEFMPYDNANELYILIMSRNHFRVNSHSRCLNIKELLARKRCSI